MPLSLRDYITRLPLFDGICPDELIGTLTESRIMEYGEGEYISRESEYDDECSIILSGKVKVLSQQKDSGRQSTSTVLGEGEIFGELAALSGNPQAIDIVALTPTSVLVIPKSTLLTIFDKFKPIKEKLDFLYRERALSSHLLSTPIFSSVPKEFLQELKSKVSLHSYGKGEVVFAQHDEADSFYLIRYGFVKVAAEEGGKTRVVAYLKEGSYFGEIAMLREGEKRNSTVSTISRTELIKISKEDFKQLIDSYPGVKKNIERIMGRRSEKSFQISQNAYMANTLNTAIESGVLQTKAVLVIDISKCVQCDKCVEACMVLHNGHSRLVRKGHMLNSFLLVPTSCRNCKDPTCMTQCPTGAITRSAAGEIYHKDSCIGCGGCAKLCPFDNITIAKLKKAIEKKRFSLFTRLFGKKNGADDKEKDFRDKNAQLNIQDLKNMVQALELEKMPGDAPVAVISSVKERKKAVVCDMCREYAFMGCVYNCPRGAIRRVDPSEYFADIGDVG